MVKRASVLPGYSTREVARLLGLSVSQVRTFVGWDFLDPRRGPRNEFRFSFQDLVILRAAKGLIEAELPRGKVRRSLERLREQLPSGRSLTSVRIGAEGSQIVVCSDSQTWEPISGQRLLDFDVAPLAEKAEPLALKTAEDARALGEELMAEDWFELALELESTALSEAKTAYERVLALDPEHLDSQLNLGRLLHEEGDLEEAERLYRRVWKERSDPVAAFNLGVALQDQGRKSDAIEAYGNAISADPTVADAYFNLAGLYQELGQEALAIQSLQAYRKLQG